MRMALWRASEIEDKRSDLTIEKQYVLHGTLYWRGIYSTYLILLPYSIESSRRRRRARITGRSLILRRQRAKPSTRG